jgi:hypothetical protein
MHDDSLRAVLETLDPTARDDLRRVLIRDQADRDSISSRLMRYRDQNGDDWADILDTLRCIRRSGGRWRGCSERLTPTRIRDMAEDLVFEGLAELGTTLRREAEAFPWVFPERDRELWKTCGGGGTSPSFGRPARLLSRSRYSTRNP